VQEKGTVPVDSVIAILGKEGEDISGLLKENGGGNGSAQKEKKEEPKKESASDDKKEVKKEEGQAEKPSGKIPDGVEVVRMPKLSDTMTEGVVAKWHKKVGDKVKSGDLLADIETDKATMEFESFQDGVLLHQGIAEGGSAPVDSILAILGKGDEDVKAILAAVDGGGGSAAKAESKPEESTGDKKEEKKEQKTEQKTESTSSITKDMHTTSPGRIKASPLAKALAKEKGIDLSKVQGSAENGRITKADIENYKPEQASSKTQVAQFDGGKESFQDESVSQMRKTIARRLLESTTSAPVFYLNIEVDMDNAMKARATMNEIPDTKISFNDLVIKACAAALRKHPQVNTSWMGDKIRKYGHIHIGMAVAVEDGLLVPVIRFADQKSLSQISAEAKDFGKRAKDKKLQPSEWEGNTFTVSNLGMFGIESFTSIINSPASCILSVGAIRQVPVVKNNQVVPGNTMMLTLACDHRTVDGATGAAFLQTLKIFIENPVTMLV
jgi:pyruvate dehydrogenase E2 component (dihydrolipoamide acetyltransferase)